MRVLVVGATGAMGQIIAKVAQEENDIKIVAGIGQGKTMLDIPIYDDFKAVKEDFDVLVDFSHSSLTPALLDFVEAVQKPAVIATTGLSDKIKERMQFLSKKTPILYAQNMSVGVNTIDTVVAALTKILSGFDIEIIEKHHNQKVDAPSGTAEMLLETVKRNRRGAYPVYDRTKKHEKRQPHEVGVASLRGGTIVGEHSVIFAGTDEVVEIKHTAGSKKIFGKGALRAARFLLKKKNGFYDMKDVLG